MSDTFGCLALLLIVWVAPATQLHAAAPEVRATWLTTTGPDHVRSGVNTALTMRDLRNVGLNTVYVETWKNGFTNFPSQTLAELTGGPDRSAFLGASRDLVAETTLHAHRNELNTIGWFEYGFSSQFVGAGGNPNNPLSNHMKDNGWLLQDVNGNYANASNGFTWMNPAVPQVRQFLIDIVLEAVNNYDLDGIQFDDRLAWPKAFGWDATTKAIYLNETGNTLSNNPNTNQLNQFNAWRQGKVKLFAQELVAAVKAVRPDLHVAISPSITPFAKTEFMADWPAWVAEGLFDEYAPQAYRESIGAFNGIIDAQVAPFQPNNRDKLVVGLRSVGSGDPTPWPDLQAMIQRTRDEAAAGHAIWFSQGVLDLYRAQLTGFYDVANQGHADSPLFGEDHRPAPIVGSFLGAANWQFDVPRTRGYQIIGKTINGDWQAVDSFLLPAGTNQLFLPGLIEAELIADNRPGLLLQGDLNADGFVGITDLNLILGNWNQTVTAGDLSQGDASGDGFVGIDDLNRVLGNWNAGTPPATDAAVPEPATLALLGLGAMTMLRRLRPRAPAPRGRADGSADRRQCDRGASHRARPR